MLKPEQAQRLLSDFLGDENGAGPSLRLQLEHSPGIASDPGTQAGAERRAAPGPRGGDEPAPLPASIGPCRIIRRIAFGGMGAVYEGEQDHPRRRVAVKVIRSGLASPATLRRFRAEAEILGKLQHPNIAQVYSAGTHDDGSGGMPYFIMEYVPNAEPITTYADRRELDIEARVKLFLQACDAVHHGHQKGFIHRDLKPANILVGTEEGKSEGIGASRHQGIEEGKHPSPFGRGVGGEGVCAGAEPSPASSPARPLDASMPRCLDASPSVRVIDFGIARATESDLAITTMHTDVREIIGTLQYMSPEQCDGDGGGRKAGTKGQRDQGTKGGERSANPQSLGPSVPQSLPSAGGLDARSDVYSLGVVLYELLCGRLPYDVHGSLIASATRIIREQDPAAPSAACRTIRRRSALEAVVLKALQKDRTRRYQSVLELATDLRHYLAGEPVSAKPPSRWMKGVRWVGRHPVAASLCLSALIVGSAIATSYWTTWYLTRWPAGLHIHEDGSAVSLVTASGKPLHTWSAGAPNGVAAARMPKFPDGRRFAVIEFTEYSALFPGEVCVFDLGGSLDFPVWGAAFKEEELLPELRDDGVTPANFRAELLDIFDIFDTPGPELVVRLQHTIRSASALRIYSLEGALLYQVWQDGGIAGCAWLKEAGILACIGHAAEVYWNQRGHPAMERSHPYVVLGLRPTLGDRGISWLRCTEPTESLAWCRTVLPLEAQDLSESIRVNRAPSGLEPERNFLLLVELRDMGGASISLLIDEHGNEVPNQRIVSDAYNRLKDPPISVDSFHLGDLPPIIEPPIQPQER